MSQRIMQINFNFTGSRRDFEAAYLPAAASIAAVPGLAWKIWLLNEATHEAGGIYLFADPASADAWEIQVKSILGNDPALSKVSVKQFDSPADLTTITRGPVSYHAYPRTFNAMAAEAMAAVPSVSPAQAHRQLNQEPDTLVIDVRDAADIVQTGTVPGAVNLSLGALTYLADQEVPESWRDPRLADRRRPLITTCILGPMGALGGKLLQDMGFTNIAILAGGVQAWTEAGYPVQPLSLPADSR